MSLPYIPPTDPLKHSPIKGPGTQQALLLRARVTRVDTQRWTVDLASSMDDRTFLDVPLASPYVDYKGAGFYGHAIQKALVLLAVPSDSTPPVVLAFLPAMRGQRAEQEGTGVAVETPTQQVALDQAKKSGKVQQGVSTSSASFASERPPLEEADWSWRGAEGNFVAMFNSGLLALGCSSLCQTLYLPLTDRLLQVFQEFEQKSPMGSVRWGLRELSRNPTQKTTTLRLYADDSYTDLRLRWGHLEPLGEPGGGKGVSTLAASLDIQEAKSFFELVFSPQGFDPETGDARAGAADGSTWRILLTEDGSGMARFSGSLLVRADKNIHLEAKETLRLAGKNLSFSGTEETKIDGGDALRLGGKLVVFNGGARTVAAQGDQVAFSVASAPFTGTLNGQAVTGVIAFQTPPLGVILPGGSGVKVP